MRLRMWRLAAPPTAPAVVELNKAPHAAPKKQKREKLLAAVRGALLGIVVLAPEAAAWQGLLQVAEHWFYLTGHWRYLVPLLFGAAAFYVALLAQRYVLRGDSALTERMLTWVYAAAGAGFNFWYARSMGHPEAALFFGGASLSAALLWDRTLRAWRRDQLREVGALERPLPRFRALRWLLSPRSTFRAFRASVLHELTTPAEALVKAEELRKMRVERGESQDLADQASEESIIPAGHDIPAGNEDEPMKSGRRPLAEVARTSKAEAVREAWHMLGLRGVPEVKEALRAVDLLAEHGVEVTQKYVREVRLRDLAALETQHAERPALTAVSGGAS